MGLVKRAGSRFWWISITVPKELRSRVGVDQIRESTGTTDKKAAQQLHDERKAKLWRQDKLGELPEATLGEAVERWKRLAATEGLRNVSDVETMLAWWIDQLGEHRSMASITRQDIMRAVEGKMTTPKSKGEKPRPASPARINRYLAAIRRLMKLAAKKWEMIKAAPEIDLLPEPKGRIRAATQDELKAILRELPEYLKPPFLFALATGLRQSNVLGLQWSQVDLVKARLLVGADVFKNGKDFGIPLNEMALTVLHDQHGKHDAAVFTVDGKPIRELEHKVWKAALQRAGVENFRWHDLRHTWATMLVEAGEDLDRIQALGGWESREMVLRYAHFRTEHLRGSSSKIDKALGGLVDKNPAVAPIGTAQFRHSI